MDFYVKTSFCISSVVMLKTFFQFISICKCIVLNYGDKISLFRYIELVERLYFIALNGVLGVVFRESRESVEVYER